MTVPFTATEARAVCARFILKLIGRERSGLEAFFDAAEEREGNVVQRVSPWQDAPSCPTCGCTAATPCALAYNPEFSPATAAKFTVSALYCQACGHEWAEFDPVRMAQAWWSAGAHEGMMSVPPDVTEERRRWAAELGELDKQGHTIELANLEHWNGPPRRVRVLLLEQVLEMILKGTRT